MRPSNCLHGRTRLSLSNPANANLVDYTAFRYDCTIACEQCEEMQPVTFAEARFLLLHSTCHGWVNKSVQHQWFVLAER
ncbi:unnamed protein product [Protopolystoma xenopodis]|uniref:Uncharacterized protein n=1 Tax=Protopolystoma xenopodis TaxID=117903 RepID=A0A3S5ADB2_9PLAT|nr:unnamed protein product [Protopolystoma xenopodis]